MLFRVNYGGESHLTKKDLKCFSDDKYACRHLFETDGGNIVIVLESRSRKERGWRISYNQSNIYFNSEEDALTFVKERFANAKEAK